MGRGGNSKLRWSVTVDILVSSALEAERSGPARDKDSTGTGPLSATKGFPGSKVERTEAQRLERLARVRWVWGRGGQ